MKWQFWQNEPAPATAARETSTKHWSGNEWVSFVVHLVLVLIPFGVSTYFQAFFYNYLFGNWTMPPLLIAIVEIPAITMVVFYLRGIPSRFLWLRHGVPFVSAIGLAHGLLLLLQHNNWIVAWLATVVVGLVIMLVSATALASIEDLFISPIEAIARKAAQQTQELRNSFVMLQTMLRGGGDVVQAYNETIRDVASITGLLPEPQQQTYARPQFVEAPVALQEPPQAVEDVQEDIVPVTLVEARTTPAIDWGNKSKTVREWKAAERTLQELVDATQWKKETLAPLWSKAS